VIIWDKNFGNDRKKESVEAPFSVPEGAETVIVEIEDTSAKTVETNFWASKGFSSK